MSATETIHRVHSRPMRSRLIAVAVCFLAALLLHSASAHAARVHQLEASEKFPHENDPTSVAVSSTTHHLFAVGPETVYEFDENGGLDPDHPELTGAALPSPTRV